MIISHQFFFVSELERLAYMGELYFLDYPVTV